MSRQVNIHEAKTHFSKLAEAVEAGEEIVIARSGKPVMRLIRFEQVQDPIKPGFAREEMSEWLDVDWAKLDKKFNQLFKND
jgi:prevent-host-death family protein